MKHSTLHVSCHPNVDRRIISEMNYLSAQDWEVAFLYTPLNLNNSGIVPEIELFSCAESAPRSVSSKRISFKRRILMLGYTILTHLPFGEIPLFKLATMLRNKSIFRKLEKARQNYSKQPEIIHVHDVWLLKYVAELKEKYYPNAKLVYDAHEFTPFQTSSKVEIGAMLTIESIGLKNYDAIIAVNNSIARRMAEIYNIPMPKVLYNSVSEEYLAGTLTRKEFLSHWGITENWSDNCIVLYQGTLSPERNLENMVKAFKILPKHLHLFILGNGPLKTTLEQLINAYDLQEQVHMAEAVEQLELIKYTKNADIGLLPYIAFDCENNRLATPNKLFEYIAAEVPVCGSDLPELIKIFDLCGNGCGYPMNSADEIAFAISDMYQKVCVKKIISKEAVQKARDEFSYKKQGTVLLELYNSLLK